MPSSTTNTKSKEFVQTTNGVQVTTAPSLTLSTEQKLLYITLGLVALETLLVGLALVPAQLWTRILPHTTNAALDGPIPSSIAPFFTFLLYVTPTVIGWLSGSWQRALLFATLPAWIGLGTFLVLATFKVGAFYLISSDHVTTNVSVLELFAALGAIGWLARHFYKIQ